MSDQIPAGWYEDPLGHFDLRYWDGDSWTSNASHGGEVVDDPIPGTQPSQVESTATVPVTAVIAADDSPTETLLPIAAVGASREPPRNAEPTTSKGLSISWAWAIAALIGALVLGGAVGAASAGDDAAKHLADERAAQINDLNRQIDRVQQQRDDARKQARLAATTTTTTTTTLPPTTTTTAPPAPFPTAPPASAPASAPTAFYANCTAARAAGVTPLHRGDPGYSSSLDRDGDGVACE